MRISSERAKELGIQMKKPEKPPKADPALAKILQEHSATLDILARYGEAMTSLMAEMERPKRYTCTVSRDTQGLINSVDIMER